MRKRDPITRRYLYTNVIAWKIVPQRSGFLQKEKKPINVRASKQILLLIIQINKKI